MCIKLIEWFNNDFLFMFETNKFKKCKESNSNELNNNIKIIIDEPKISQSNSNEPSIEIITNDKYDLYTWDML
jgi:hypothetical protein